MTTFNELDIRADILTGLAALGFATPTPIQQEVIPLILEQRRDLISLAQTGTGKTAAFGIPLVQLTEVARRQIQALVLCPTRELCVQVARDLEGMARHVAGIKILPVYGGTPIEGQIRALRQGVHIIVATPGRLLDLIRRRSVDISGVVSMVLDEADEMLNMGFQEELNAILAETPADKNTMLFSATMPKGVSTIARKYMTDPLEITIGKLNAGAENVRHLYYMVQAKNRYPALKRIVDINPEMYAIIFCRTRQETKELADKLMQDGYTADALHGDLSQPQRDHIMNKFRRRNLQILVATDVAARGLDVSDLTHVINYNLPDDAANYTHRSGRTGRAGKEGTAISIIHMREKFRIRELQQRLGKTFEHRRVPSGYEVCKKQLQSHVDTVMRVSVDHERLDSLLPIIEEKLAGLERDELIKRFVSLEFNRILDYYRDAQDLNEPEIKTGGPRSQERSAGRPPRDDANFVRFSLNIGRRDGVLPTRLIGMINEAVGTKKIAIGKIIIAEKHSLLDADGRYAEAIFEAFRHQMINGKPVRVEVAKGAPGEGVGKGRPKPPGKGKPRFGAKGKRGVPFKKS